MDDLKLFVVICVIVVLWRIYRITLECKGKHESLMGEFSDTNYKGHTVRGDYEGVATIIYDERDEPYTPLWRTPYDNVYVHNAKSYWMTSPPN